MNIYLSPFSTQPQATLLTVESYLSSLGHTLVAYPTQADTCVIVGTPAKLDQLLAGYQVVAIDINQLFQQQFDLSKLVSFAYPTATTLVSNTTSHAMTSIANTSVCSNNQSKTTKHIVAITACPTGVAHTFMAAEAITNYCKEQGWDIKVETRGQVGVGNPLTTQDIAQADLVFIACDIEVNLEMFQGKRLYKTSTALALKQPDIEFAKAFDTTIIYNPTSNNITTNNTNTPIKTPEQKNKSTVNPLDADFGNKEPIDDSNTIQPDETSTGIYKHLMTGVSFMLPITIAGGLAMALSFIFGIYAYKTPGTIPAALMQIGSDSAFKLMLAIFSGYVAFSIADRPGLAPGLITGFLATNLGAGFVGAIITGFVSGYFTLFLKRTIKLPASIASLKPILLLPFISTVVVGLFTIYLIGPYVSIMVEHLKEFIASMSGASSIVMGMILGIMMCIDLGGPINKAAYVVAVGLISDGVYTMMAAVMAAGMVPPLGMAIATWIARSKFNDAQRSSGNVAFILGLCFISEGAIPFAAVDPVRVITSTVIGGAITGALSMYFNVQLLAPHGGIFVVFTVNHVLAYLAAIASGAITTGVVYSILKPRNFEI